MRSHAPQDLLNSRTILIWGRNPIVTNIHMLPLLKTARERGATVVVIDPRRTETVKYADQHVALKPGGDAYLAIGLAQSLLRQGLVDWEFLSTATANFADFQRLLEGVDQQTILDQTRAYPLRRSTPWRIAMAPRSRGAFIWAWGRSAGWPVPRCSNSSMHWRP